jgi:hypothetical protein
MSYHRKIKCPRHFIGKPGKSPWKLRPNPFFMNLPKWAWEKWPNLRKYIPIRDKWGNKVRDDKNFYQPFISASFAVHQIYDPKNPICQKCNVKCTRRDPEHDPQRSGKRSRNTALTV